MNLLFDIETNGLLEDTTKIHSLVIFNEETRELVSCTDHKGYIYGSDNSYKGQPIWQGLKLLEEADVLIGHNIVKFDLPAIEKIYPEFNFRGKTFDILLVSKLVYPDVGELDDMNIRKERFPKKLRGKYSLKAWGYRLGELKRDYCEQFRSAREQNSSFSSLSTDYRENCWLEWTPGMQRYCEQDVMVTKKLYDHLKKQYLSPQAFDIEHKFAKIIGLQEQRGVCFDKEKAIEFASILVEEKADLERKLKLAFPNEIKEEVFVPKVNNKSRGYVKGEPFTKRIEIEFNPSSRQMLAQGLIKKYGWKPEKKTETGLAVIDEEVIESLDYPEAPLLKQWFIVTKTLGALTEGRNAWLKTEKQGIIHGGVDTIGAVTGRCSHSNPNLAQVPSAWSAFGKECRELFKAREGFRLIGTDASGLELRMLAHYMKDPSYTNEILNGDIHTKNQLAAGLPT